jgi:iron(III) transport system ATP-binding protein
MDYVEIKGLVKKFGHGIVAVNKVSFEVKKGEFLTLLGPSGCGKTTILRCIGGLETSDEGEIVIDGQYVTSADKGIFVPPEKRGLGMVFQSYAIWPHMSVFSNVSYGLEMRRTSKKEIRCKVMEVLEVVGLQDLAERNATTLSGGQQQRVALARALAFNPRLLLFDEPLSNLDAKLRERMRFDLKKLVKEVGITSIYVTHDQAEAMAISDSILVMNAGKIIQKGDARTIYSRPLNKFVADFIGVSNFLHGKVEQKEQEPNWVKVKVQQGEKSSILNCFSTKELTIGSDVTILIRPEKIRISETYQKDGNVIEGKVIGIIYLGNLTEYFVSLGETVFRLQTSQDLSLSEGMKIYLRVDPTDCICLKE